MPLAEEIVTSRYRITAYSSDSVTINEVVYRDSLVLSANAIHSPWEVTGIDQIDAASLDPITRLNPEVVLLGTGERQSFPDAKIFAMFGQQGVGLEVMDNGALCRTFNILVAEDRVVVAAILLGN
jgi:uncharacterized protein